MKKAVIIDSRFSGIAQKAWGELFDIIPSAKCEYAPEAISFHPDVVLTNICGEVICAPCVYEYYKEKLTPYGVNLKKGELNPKSNYPEDSAYNIAVTPKAAVFKKGAADGACLSAIREKNLAEIYVNQGYAKCSSVVAKDAIITADSSIFSACENLLDCLKISEGGVALAPYEYGFLGGASGYYGGAVFFFGDITKHQDFSKIVEFLKKRNIETVYIKNFPLTDIGTVFFPY